LKEFSNPYRRLSEKSIFLGILTYEINVTQRSIAFYI
jgi:hypothetical protein